MPRRRGRVLGANSSAPPARKLASQCLLTLSLGRGSRHRGKVELLPWCVNPPKSFDSPIRIRVCLRVFMDSSVGCCGRAILVLSRRLRQGQRPFAPDLHSSYRVTAGAAAYRGLCSVRQRRNVARGVALTKASLRLNLASETWSYTPKLILLLRTWSTRLL